MKTYTVTFREWMYQEKTIIVEASSKEEAEKLAENEMDCWQDDRNKNAEWFGHEFKPLKPRIRVSK